jgi:hypothetical protein
MAELPSATAGSASDTRPLSAACARGPSTGVPPQPCAPPPATRTGRCSPAATTTGHSLRNTSQQGISDRYRIRIPNLHRVSLAMQVLWGCTPSSRLFSDSEQITCEHIVEVQHIPEQAHLAG